jgi:hypothetical protein
VILCPGASALGYRRRDGDTVIAVNRGALIVPSDIWCAKDWQTVREVTPLGSPIVYTIGESVERAGRVCLSMDAALARYERRLSLFTKGCAMMLADWLGFGEIELVGDDMRGTLDFDGVTGPRDRRTDERWQQERELTDALIRAMRDRGVVIA